MTAAAGPWLRAEPRERAEHAAAVVAMLALVLVVFRGGGREPGTTALATLATLPALLLTRAWQWVPSRLVWLLAALPAAALLTGYLTPTGFGYPRDLGVLAYAALLSAAGLAYLRTERRVTALAGAVVVLGFLQAVAALVPWQARGVQTVALTGTFYQPNMLATLLGASALVAWALALLHAWSPLRLLAGAVGPVCVACTVLTNSRSGQGLLAAGLLSLALLALRSPRRWRLLGVWAVLAASSAAVLLLLTSAVFVGGTSGQPFEGTTQRSGSDSLTSSASVRDAYWDAAVQQFAESPVAGQGFGSFGLTFQERSPLGSFASRYAHNGYLQALAEGGVLLAAPVVLLTLGGLWCAVRAALERQAPAAAVGCAAATGLLIVHAMVDFDWTFSALVGVLCLVAAAGWRRRDPVRRPGPVPTAALVAVVLVATAPVVLYGEDGQRGTVASARGPQARAVSATVFPNPLLDVGVLRAAVSSAPARQDDAAVLRAVDRTRGLAEVDPEVAALRGKALIAAGREEEGLQVLRLTAERFGDKRVGLEIDHALALRDAGRVALAVQVLSRGVRDRARPGFPEPEAVWQLVLALQQVGGPTGVQSRCAYTATVRAFGEASRPSYVPAQTAPC